MKIEKTDDGNILIIVSDDELSAFGLKSSDLGKKSRREMRFINNILSMAEIKTGIQLKGRQIVLENKPFAGGCILVVCLDKKHRLRLKQRRYAGRYFFLFDDKRRLFSCAAMLNKSDIHLSASLYRRGGEYILIVPKGIRGSRALPLIALFGRQMTDFPAPAGDPVCEHRAVSYLAEKIRKGKDGK